MKLFTFNKYRELTLTTSGNILTMVVVMGATAALSVPLQKHGDANRARWAAEDAKCIESGGTPIRQGDLAGYCAAKSLVIGELGL